MINNLYGIDYDTYFCGGRGNYKLHRAGSTTLFFDSESDMLRVLAELKNDHAVGNISVFTTVINRIQYKVE